MELSTGCDSSGDRHRRLRWPQRTKKGRMAVVSVSRTSGGTGGISFVENARGVGGWFGSSLQDLDIYKRKPVALPQAVLGAPRWCRGLDWISTCIARAHSGRSNFNRKPKAAAKEPLPWVAIFRPFGPDSIGSFTSSWPAGCGWGGRRKLRRLPSGSLKGWGGGGRRARGPWRWRPFRRP